jgi:hypothetical protein
MKWKMKIIRRRIIVILLIILVILIIISLAPPLFYKKEINTNPLAQHYKKGVYHVHSLYSDGRGSIDQITKAAAQCELDFVILTDHGGPNLESSSSTGWLNQVLLIGGTEISLNSGHLAAVGYSIPAYIFPPEPQEAIYEIYETKGISFISHPFDYKTPWTDWNVYGFTGLEILSTYSSAKNASTLRLILFPLQYLINSKYAILNTLQYPRMNIKKWDLLNSDKTGFQYYGIFALDAHASLPITETFNLHFPSYESMFRILTVYIKLNNEWSSDPKKAATQIVSSLKRGHFFNVIEAIASANGFNAYFKLNNGDNLNMGETTSFKEGTFIIKLPFVFSTDIFIIRNGSLFKKIVNNTSHEVSISIKSIGTYRIEVYVSKNKFSKLPWIMTNPFFLGKDKTILRKDQLKYIIKKDLATKKGFFKVEKNNSSVGEISYGFSESKSLITTLTFKLTKEPNNNKDFWSALAARNRYNFTGYKGFKLLARSCEKRRFWIEFRTGDKEDETWYRHSFLVEKAWTSIEIPFDKFYVIYGKKRLPTLSNVNSIFISINNANAYPNTEGRIDIKELGLF